MNDLPLDLIDLAKEVLSAAKAAKKRIVTAESCTGGMLAGCLTANAGSSEVVDCGFITYSNESKSRLLGVPRDAIADLGAVSDVVASAMAEGALAQTDADMAVSITGIAGPAGGTKEKPVGLVYMALAQTGRDALVKRYIFAGTRSDIRRAAVGAAMELLLGSMKGE
ncbi:MAG: CinA family protein [Rhodospirillaceae bacterium]|nr:CinA family protein [Rhodospirillaceae bacterium]